MAYFPDQSPCDYFGDQCALQLRAVGWLARDQPYSTGPTDKRVYDRLVDWCRDPWQPMLTLGIHTCDLCQFDGAAGRAVLFIPDLHYAWVCPELITHYVNAHGYRPPDEFCQAVLGAPEMRSMAYLKALRDCAPGLIRRGVAE